MAITPVELDTPRGRLAARSAGDPGRPLVVCLHGFPDDASTFDGLLATLAAAGFRAVAPYCRGYAPSPLANPDGSGFGPDLFAVLAADAAAVAAALSPAAPAHLVGHDNGAFTVYHALRDHPARFGRAVTLAAGHPAAVFRNALRSPAQWWRSRYAALFQLPRLGDWYARRADFAYVERLWRRWSPGWEPPADHLRRVKATLRASWPAPLGHYRSGAMGTGGRWGPLPHPLLYLIGRRDGCVRPAGAAGQERLFAGPYRMGVVDDAGHFPHLEQPAAVGPAVVGWLTATDPHHPRAAA